MSQRAVVIGGGVIGVASAFFLNRSGWKVTVAERDQPGRGCSYKNACLIVPSHSHPLPAPGVLSQAVRWMLRRDSPFYVKPRLDPGLLRWAWMFRRACTAEAAERGYRALLGLSQLSLDLYQELLRSGDVDFFFERRGLLEVYLTEEAFAGAERELHILASMGRKAKILSSAEAVALEPALKDTIAGAMFIEGEAHGLSYDYVSSMAQTLEREGVRFLIDRTVTGVNVVSGRVQGVRVRNQRPGEQDRRGRDSSADRTGAAVEDITADLVVLAAGSWSAELAASFGLRLPLQPAKGYSSTIDAYSGGPRLPIMIKEKRVIVTPLKERLRFGGTLELAGFDTRLDPVRYRMVVESARDVLKPPVPMVGEEPWCGLRPLTPDGLPVIDRMPGVDGLIIATGHGMLGFTQSPGTGRVVAELANHQTPTVPLDAFRVSRFQN